MASFIVSTSKSIDEYLNALPSIDNKEEEQLARIEELQNENKRYENEILELVAVAGPYRPLLRIPFSFALTNLSNVL